MQPIAPPAVTATGAMTSPRPPPTSSRTVLVALIANLGVAATKVFAAIVTRSTAMTAEASHACADVGNQVLLVVAQRRSTRPATHGRSPRPTAPCGRAPARRAPSPRRTPV